MCTHWKNLGNRTDSRSAAAGPTLGKKGRAGRKKKHETENKRKKKGEEEKILLFFFSHMHIPERSQYAPRPSGESASPILTTTSITSATKNGAERSVVRVSHPYYRAVYSILLHKVVSNLLPMLLSVRALRQKSCAVYICLGITGIDEMTFMWRKSVKSKHGKTNAVNDHFDYIRIRGDTIRENITKDTFWNKISKKHFGTVSYFQAQELVTHAGCLSVSVGGGAILRTGPIHGIPRYRR